MSGQEGALVVRFDEELRVTHRIAEGDLPCPRGVLVEAKPAWQTDARNGRLVRACALAFGHAGDCIPLIGKHRTTTVCGLSLADLPFVPSPDGLPPCPDCFGLTAAPVVEDVMFA